MAVNNKMVDSKQLSKKLSENALKTINNHLDIVIKSQDLPVGKSAEMKKDNEAVFASQINKAIDELVEQGISEDEASVIVEKAFNQILDEIQQQKLQVAALIDDNTAKIEEYQSLISACQNELLTLQGLSVDLHQGQ